MEDTNRTLLGDFDELEKTVAEEERNRSVGFVEEPLTAQVRYDFIGALKWLFASANLVQFARDLNRFFRMRIQDLEWQGDEDLSAVMSRRVLTDGDLIFADGVLHIEDTARTMQINTIRVSTQKIWVHLIAGTSAEARWVAQKTIELLLLSSNLSLSWTDFVDKIESEAYLTRTKAHIGVDISDLLSHPFKDFVQNNLAKTDSLGTKMGTRSCDKQLREVEQKAIVGVPQIHGVEMRLSLLNETTGVCENCNVRFDVLNRLEHGQGILTLSTELDSVLHTQLINQFRSAILERSET